MVWLSNNCNILVLLICDIFIGHGLILYPYMNNKQTVGFNNSSPKSYNEYSEKHIAHHSQEIKNIQHSRNYEVNQKTTRSIVESRLRLTGIILTDDRDHVSDVREQRSVWKQEKVEKSPYAVLLLVKTARGQGACTGTLVSAEWVLTAATCITTSPVSEVLMYAGGRSLEEWQQRRLARGSQERRAAETHYHPKYHKGDFKAFFNVAVIKADRAFRVTKTVAPVELSTHHLSFAGTSDCQITGFGRARVASKLELFRKTQSARVETPCRCFDEPDSDFWVCPSPHEPPRVCLGDMGAGLLCDNKLTALYSHTVPARHVDSCDLQYVNYYDCNSNSTIHVFQGTCPYLRFINEYVKLFPKDKVPRDCQLNPQKALITENHIDSVHHVGFFLLVCILSFGHIVLRSLIVVS